MQTRASSPIRRPRLLSGVGHLIGALRNLGLLPVGFSDRDRVASFPADDGQLIPVKVTGDGPPVVLVHGLGCSHSHWARVARRLVRKHRVYVWDARGHGDCHVTETSHITLARLARDLANMIEFFGLESVALVGHSMGALAVMQFLRDFGVMRVAAVCLVDQSPRVVTDEDWRLGLFGGCSASMLGGLISGARSNLADTVLRQIDAAAGDWLRRRLAPHAMLGRWLRRWLKGIHVEPLLDLCESLAAADFRPLFSRFDVPLLVVLGGLSPHYAGLPLDAWYQEKVPHARVLRFEDSGHSPHYAEPARFARELRQFFEEHAFGGAR